MAMEQVPDEYGDTMKLMRCDNGRLTATDFNPDTVNGMPTMPLRNDDVMLCSYSKSGCHWLWEVIECLTKGEERGLDKVDKENCMVEWNSLDSLAALPSPRVLNNHGFFEDQPSDLVAKQVKVVFVYRNVKDVSVSFYHHHTRFKDYTGPFSRYVRRFVQGLVDNGSVFEYLRNWEKAILNTPSLPVHILSYEDMKEDPLSEVRRVNEFLGTKRSEEFMCSVVEMTAFDAMKTRKREVTIFKDDDGEPVMYRKGEVGDWKNYYTVAENEWMDGIIQREMAGSTLFNFRYHI